MEKIKQLSQQFKVPVTFNEELPSCCYTNFINISFKELLLSLHNDDIIRFWKHYKYSIDNWDLFVVQVFLHELCHWKQLHKYGREWYFDDMYEEYAEEVAHRYAIRYFKKVIG